ncbi:MAG: hypothetical protein GX589_04215 [Deltaproteobacteria bacterium]|nr:hypothetical protein [Deltaproteobacteria bacterium]
MGIIHRNRWFHPGVSSSKISKKAFCVVLLGALVLASSFAGAQEVTFPGAPGTVYSSQLVDLVKQTAARKGLPYTFSSSSPASFLRSTGASGSGNRWTNDGVEDLVTLRAICKIMGYKRYVRSTCLDAERSGNYPNGKCNYHTPHNNSLLRLGSVGGNFYAETAVPKYGKTWVATITCADPITQCNDGVDNDRDSLIDAQDPGCWDDIKNPATYNPKLNNEGRATSECQDRIDNDGDGLIDAKDPGCWDDIKNPATYNPKLNDEGRATSECQDRIDNDRDGLIDAKDPGCWDDMQNPATYNPKLNDESRATVGACNDGIDNDGDGYIDYDDKGCIESGGKSECHSSLTECDNCIDDDRDGKIDSADECCTVPWGLSESDCDVVASQCNDGIDNDHDGHIDSADLGCKVSGGKSECHSSLTECDNCIDDDGDGLIDMQDPCCRYPWDTSESVCDDVPGPCSDRKDNDGDGYCDYADLGCKVSGGKSECHISLTQCDNCIDDDGDGLIDMQDPGCMFPWDVSEGCSTNAAKAATCYAGQARDNTDLVENMQAQAGELQSQADFAKTSAALRRATKVALAAQDAAEEARAKAKNSGDCGRIISAAQKYTAKMARLHKVVKRAKRAARRAGTIGRKDLREALQDAKRVQRRVPKMTGVLLDGNKCK